jgi:carboxypeptidase Q
MPMRLASLCLLCALALSAEDNAKTLSAVGEIKNQAFDNSQVMDTLSYLADVYGPRLTASPQFDQAAKWAMDRLKSYGIENVHEEAWGPFGRSWSVESYTIDMVAPQYSHLVATPLAWSGPTNGAVTGDVMKAPMPAREYNPKKLAALIRDFETKWKGKLRGKIVLISAPHNSSPETGPNFERYKESELSKIAQAPVPVVKKKTPPGEFDVPEDPDERREYLSSLPESAIDDLFDQLEAERNKLNGFLSQEGVVAVLREDRRAHDGLLFAEAAGSEKAASPLAPPTFIVTEEQYTRMSRLLEKKVPVTVRVDVKVKDSATNQMGQNIIGEIRGRAKPDEVVMIGAHFDSWHTATGATDNGAGSAVMMEVMRILKRLDAPMRRTVRIGLWSGEEQGLYGSKAYVKQHFADPQTMKTSAEHQNFDVYFNLDNGSGKIRGVYLQGNDAARPLFEQYLEPFHDMGASTITLKNTGGTDHLSFDAVGLPGFQFIQDPLDYYSVTHHSDMDTYSHAIPADLMQASAIIAAMVYQAANQDEKFPRKPLPKAESR